MNEMNHKRYGRVRTHADNGRIWYCASDVAAILGYKNAAQVVDRICAASGVRKFDAPTVKGSRAMTFIDTQNVDRIVSKGKHREHKAIKDWLLGKPEADELMPVVVVQKPTTSAIKTPAQLFSFATGDEKFPVSGRELHAGLCIESQYSKWFGRLCEYGFQENEDYKSFMTDRVDGLPGKPRNEHFLTMTMAKEVCMLQRSELGRQIRKYLIEIEEAWNSPEQVMARALRIADKKIAALEGRNIVLQKENAVLAKETMTWDPKKFIERAVGAYAKTFIPGVHTGSPYSYAWGTFKRQVNTKLGINIESRIAANMRNRGVKTRPPTLSMLNSDELKQAAATVVAMCRYANVDISELMLHVPDDVAQALH